MLHVINLTSIVLRIQPQLGCVYRSINSKDLIVLRGDIHLGHLDIAPTAYFIRKCIWSDLHSLLVVLLIFFGLLHALLLPCYLLFHVYASLTNYLLCCPVRRRRLLDKFWPRFKYNWRFCLHLLFLTMLRIATFRALFNESFLTDNHLSKILILTSFQDNRSLCLLIWWRWILLETTG